MKSISDRKEKLLYALSVDPEENTIDITVFDHETGGAASLYLPADLAQAMADALIHQIQLLKRS